MARNTSRIYRGFKYPLLISGYLSNILRNHSVNRQFFHGLPQHTEAIQRSHDPAVDLIHINDVIIQSGRVRIRIPTKGFLLHELLNGRAVAVGNIRESVVNLHRHLFRPVLSNGQLGVDLGGNITMPLIEVIAGARLGGKPLRRQMSAHSSMRAAYALSVTA